MDEAYDFIVIGGGASGCVVASRLARSKAKPSILLLEAGGSNEELEHLSGAERFDVAFKPGSKLNWGYNTTPQFGREVDYSRGKGLGGSTAINFCGWVSGADADYNEWARIVDNDSFAWPHVQECLKRVEKLHPQIPADFKHHIRPRTEDHGAGGLVNVGYGTAWLQSTKDVFTAAEQSGLGLNPDVNSGNPLGMGVGTVCIHNGQRQTAATTYLKDRPLNLTIRTNTQIRRVLVEDHVASGVEATDGRKFRARCEVVISTGAINSPQLLMLSGIGSADELAAHGIEVVCDLPQVGRNLQDHCFSSAGIVLKRKSNSPEAKQVPTPMGWFKIKAVEKSREHRNLSSQMQRYLKMPTVPHWELATHTPFFDGEEVGTDEEVFSSICLVMNPQSRGKITLASTDPYQAPLIDPAFLSHPYDRRVMIEAMRQMLQFFQAPVFRERTVRTLAWPEADNDEAILSQCKSHLQSSWHACGTVAMGRDTRSSCVDNDFRVLGLERLRVVDMSVCPLIPNNHTQTTAYLIGEIAAGKLIKEYHLDRLESL